MSYLEFTVLLYLIISYRNQDMNSSQVIRMFIRDYIKKYGKKRALNEKTN